MMLVYTKEVLSALNSMVSLYLKFAEMQANGEYQIYVRLG